MQISKLYMYLCNCSSSTVLYILAPKPCWYSNLAFTYVFIEMIQVHATTLWTFIGIDPL